MSASEGNVFDEESRQRMAAEVLELGESLFDLALEAGNNPQIENQEGDVGPIEEIQATTQEFFTALRLLLRIEK